MSSVQSYIYIYVKKLSYYEKKVGKICNAKTDDDIIQFDQSILKENKFVFLSSPVISIVEASVLSSSSRIRFIIKNECNQTKKKRKSEILFMFLFHFLRFFLFLLSSLVLLVFIVRKMEILTISFSLYRSSSSHEVISHW